MDLQNEPIRKLCKAGFPYLLDIARGRDAIITDVLDLRREFAYQDSVDLSGGVTHYLDAITMFLGQAQIL